MAEGELQSKEKKIESIVEAVANALRNKPLGNINIRLVAIFLIFLNHLAVDKIIDALTELGIHIPFKIRDFEPWYSITWGIAIAWFFARAVYIRMKQLGDSFEDNIADHS